MKTSDFEYELPQELVAQYPAKRRDESRLLVLDRETGEIEHRVFRDILGYVVPGDLLVVNESAVIPARFVGRKKDTGGAAEMFLLKEVAPSRWEVLVKPGARIRKGAVLEFGSGSLRAEVQRELGGGKREVMLTAEGQLDRAIDGLGQVPLPPYIQREPEDVDRERYQTVYARVRGAVAAPTAGLHFTDSLLNEIREKGVRIVSVLLHVGLGTFRPVSADDPEAHSMEEEYFELSPEAAEAVNETRRNAGRVFAVGTTTVRVLETLAGKDGTVSPGGGWTGLYIKPPYEFRCVDALVTNFHLPRSTLLMLVSAFGERRKVLACYREAVEKRYRFYSYGDAMLIA